MRVSCPFCQTSYNIDSQRIPTGGAKLKCAKCHNSFPAVADGAAPGGGGSIPLPGKSFASSDAASVPLPGRSFASGEAASVPLPGSSSNTPTFPELTRAVPTREYPVPLPGAEPNPEARGAPEDAPWADDAAVPLPGSGEGSSQSDPFDFGFGEPPAEPDEPTTSVALPAPGALDFGFEEPPAEPGEPTTTEARPAPGAIDFGFDEPAVPSGPTDPGRLPNSGAEPDPFDFGAPSDPVPLPAQEPKDFHRTAHAAPVVPSPPDVQFEEEGQEAEVDFFEEPEEASVPLPGTGEERASEPAGLNAHGGGFSLDDFPAPPASAEAPPLPEGFDFGETSEPAHGSRAGASSAADSFGLDFDAPPSAPAEAPRSEPSAPPLSFGEVDFGLPSPPEPSSEPEPPARAYEAAAPTPQLPDDPMALDFGPDGPGTVNPFGQAPAAATRSAETAPSTTSEPSPEPGGARFQVRRRSGKVFGPFDEATVQQMLRDGQFVGNEEVSTDGETWDAIGTVPAFASAVSDTMGVETDPGAPAGASIPPFPDDLASGFADTGSSSTDASSSTPSAPRAGRAHQGRTAQVATLQKEGKGRFKLPKITLTFGPAAKKVAIAAAVVAVIGAGASLGFTKYGAFGLKKIFPAQLAQGSPEEAQLREAREKLLAGSYADFTEALTIAQKLLASREVPEVRALYCQAVFYLQRMYGAKQVDPNGEADAAMEGLELLGETHPEVIKAQVGLLLRNHQPDGALPLLQDAAARTENARDVELGLLRAEAYAAKKQGRLARELLSRVPTGASGSGRALHALGELDRAEGKADSAAEFFRKALEADPGHLSSAVELADLELFARNDPARADKALDRALDPKRRNRLSPGELAHAQALRGAVLLEKKQLKEATAVLEEALKNDPDSALAQAQLGSAFAAQSDYARAAPLLLAASVKDPSNVKYAEGALAALLATGKIDEAAKLAEGAKRRFPTDARIAYYLGRLRDEQDQPQEAESELKRAIAAEPGLHQAQLALARLMLRFRRLSDAKAPLEEAAKLAPDAPLIRAGKGELALAEGDLSRAQAEFERAAAVDPKLPDAHLGLSRVASGRGDHEKAKILAEKALSLAPDSSEGRLQLGVALWKLGDMKGAVTELNKAKALSPKSGAVAVTLGAVKMDQNDLKGAEDSLRNALSTDPHNPQALFYLAQVQSRQGDPTNAIGSIREAIERIPKNPEYHHVLGVILRAARRLDEAVAAWKETLAIEPSYADSWQAMGETLILQEKYPEAIAALESGIKVAPKRAAMFALAGDAYFESKKWSQATSRYKEALALDPSMARLVYKTGRAFAEQGKQSDAVVWYKKATTAEPENPMPFYYLGFAYKERHQRQEALEAFQTYLAKKPDADDKREISDEIYDLQH